MRRIMAALLLCAALLLASQQTRAHAQHKLLAVNGAPLGLLGLWKLSDALPAGTAGVPGGPAALRGPVSVPVGAVFVGEKKLPVLGGQRFVLTTVSRKRCRITLSGPMNLDEDALYREEPGQNGETRVIVDFNEPTLDLLARYRTRIRSTTYHADGDYAMLELKPKLLPRIFVKLERAQ